MTNTIVLIGLPEGKEKETFIPVSRPQSSVDLYGNTMAAVIATSLCIEVQRFSCTFYLSNEHILSTVPH